MKFCRFGGGGEAVSTAGLSLRHRLQAWALSAAQKKFGTTGQEEQKQEILSSKQEER